MDTKHHDFELKTELEKINRKPLDLVYRELGYFRRLVKDKELQLLGCDVAIKNGKDELFVDEKITDKNWKFTTHLLLEVDNIWNNSGKRYKIGWALDESLINHLHMDYCVETGQYFLYDSKKVKAWLKENLRDLNTYPKWTEKSDEAYCPGPAPNKWMKTYNVFIPRKFLSEFLIDAGIVNSKEGIIL